MALYRRSATHGQLLGRILGDISQNRRSLTSDNISVIQKEFTKQATVFENQWNQRMKRDNKEIMGWVIKQLGEVSKDMRALDVASGTGIFARALAPMCRLVNFEKRPRTEEGENFFLRYPFHRRQFSLILFLQRGGSSTPYPLGRVQKKN